MKKNNNAITINVNDDIKREIEIISAYYERKPAELLRLLLVPCIINEYAKIQTIEHQKNKAAPVVATFKN